MLEMHSDLHPRRKKKVILLGHLSIDQSPDESSTALLGFRKISSLS